MLLQRQHFLLSSSLKTLSVGPRNDVLTGGFIRFSLARTLTRIIFLVPRLRSPRNPEGVANQEGYLRCSKRFDHIGVTLQVLALFEFKSVDERP